MKTMNAEEMDVSNSVKAFVDMGIYQSEGQAIQDAINHLIKAHPEYRIKLAVYRYRDEEISIGKAAEIAGVSFERMKELLIENGIQPRLGARTLEEACEEVKTYERYLN
jgi:predicted HTH domain antitoxin